MSTVKYLSNLSAPIINVLQETNEIPLDCKVMEAIVKNLRKQVMERWSLYLGNSNENSGENE